MGLFSNFFGGGHVTLAEPLAPVHTVTVDKSRRKNKFKQSTNGKENSNNVNKQRKKSGKSKKGWFNRKKNDKKKGMNKQKSAPKLSIFLQQSSHDDQSLNNNTIETGSLTASLSASLNSSPSAKLDSHHDSTNTLNTLPSTRPPSSSGVASPALHESYPMNDIYEVSDSDLNSEREIIEASSPNVSLPLHEKTFTVDETAKSDSTADSSSQEDLSPESSAPKQKRISKFGNKGEASTHLKLPLYQNNQDDPDPALEMSDVSSDEGESPTKKKNKDLESEPPSIDFRPEHSYIQDSHSLAESEDISDKSHNLENGRLSYDLIFSDLQESSTEIMNLLFPHAQKFEDSDFFSAVDSIDALDDGSLGNGSANADLSSQLLEKSKLDESQMQSIQLEFDLDFLKNKNLEVNQEKETIESQVQRSFEDIVNEVEETIATSQRKNTDNGPWIANGLLSTLRDDSSSTQQSVISFTSEDFKEEETNISSPQISTIIEEEGDGDDGSNDPIDAAMDRGRLKSLESKIDATINIIDTEKAVESEDVISTVKEEESRQTVASIVDPFLSSRKTTSVTMLSSKFHNGFSSSQLNTCSPPKSALLSKSLPRPELKKTVSWKDETDVFTYMPAQAQDLQRARDLVATYEKMMETLNARRPLSAEIKSGNNDDDKSASSDTDLSETSLSVESLLSAISHDSSTSKESIKMALEQIAQEAMKLSTPETSMPSIQQSELSLGNKPNESSQATDHKFPDAIGTNNSSSSFESIVSAISNASNHSSESMKLVIQRLKEEAERQVIFSSQKLEEARSKAMREQNEGNDSSVSSASSSPSTASSTGTSESVKALMAKLKNERTRQVQVFSSTRDLFSLLNDNTEKEEARLQILENDWVDGGESGSSSSLSSLLSASPNSSASTTDSSESVLKMMTMLKNEKERQKERRNKLRSVKEFVDSVCCIPSNSQIIIEQRMNGSKHWEDR